MLEKQKNDDNYHIYDITKKLRDTAHRLNGVDRLSKSFALQNSASTNSIGHKSENVNSKYSLDDNSENKNVNTEYVVEYENLVKALENGEISLEEFRNATNELYYTAGKEYGTIKQGESVMICQAYRLE